MRKDILKLNVITFGNVQWVSGKVLAFEQRYYGFKS